jgi:glycosyltransferase involved in cell wall biosynthesis
MKKVLIISYFYPPCSLTAAQRVYSFAKYLPDFGLSPIVVSRNWDHPIRNQEDLSAPSGEKEHTLTNEQTNIHYLPFKGSYRDQFLVRFGEHRWVFFRKILTFFEVLLECFGLFSKDKVLLYKKAWQVIKNEDISYLIISANPFWQFYFGHLLKREFPTLKWIADYRDDWTTGKLGKKRDALNRFVNWLSKRCEKRWLLSADLVTSVSDVLSKRIGEFVNKEASTVANGFFPNQDQIEHKPDINRFTVSYTGYLYGEQQIEWFLEAFKSLVTRHGNVLELKVQFVGSAYEKRAENRIRKIMQGYENNLLTTNRLSRKESIKLESQSDLLLMVAYQDLKGIPGSKLYQYIGSKKPIFLCPSDNDIVESILTETGLGIICRKENEVLPKLEELIQRHLQSMPLLETIKEEQINKYSRKKQAEKLATLLKKL